MRVEPAFGRVVDFLVGEGFAEWVIASGRAGLKMTEAGQEAASVVDELQEILTWEKNFLDEKSAAITEGFVNDILAAGRQV